MAWVAWRFVQVIGETSRVQLHWGCHLANLVFLFGAAILPTKLENHGKSTRVWTFRSKSAPTTFVFLEALLVTRQRTRLIMGPAPSCTSNVFIFMLKKEEPWEQGVAPLATWAQYVDSHSFHPLVRGHQILLVFPAPLQPLTAAGSFCHMAANLGSSWSIRSSSWSHWSGWKGQLHESGACYSQEHQAFCP